MNSNLRMTLLKHSTSQGYEHGAIISMFDDDFIKMNQNLLRNARDQYDVTVQVLIVWNKGL